MVKKEVQNDEPAITFYSVFFYPNNYSAEDFNKGVKSKGPGRFAAGLDEMFEKGTRKPSGVGYERGNKGTSGMTYGGTYYDRCPKNKVGVPREWYYPVDKRVYNEELTNPDRYMDTHDFGMNTSLFGDFWSSSELESVKESKETGGDTGDTGMSAIRQYLNEGNQTIQDSPELSAVKTILMINGYENKYFVPAYNFYKNLATVIRKLNAASDSGYSYEISIKGSASVHGYGTKGQIKPGYVTDITGEEQKILEKDEGVKSNEILAENRAAVIEGWMRNLGVFNFGSRDTISHSGTGQIDKSNDKTESDLAPKAARAAIVTLKIIPAKTKIEEVQEDELIPHMEEKTISSTTEEHSYKEYYDTSKSDDYENDTYDNEYTYFKQINENDDMVKRYISDKVDYFDPAFHSITPEGFNARLTFLQQCTRQGPTISASDLGMGSAYGAGNLSFGRAPFCVLRIGDFFNTKICIQSINIEYDNGGGPQWDLNPEGIGLQPMLANVNITFTFLGGSDISGPIARLQNAASFNYYANTSVYDRRSDYREAYITKENDTSMTWSPVILNKNEDANVITHLPFWTKVPQPPEGSDKK